MPKYELSNGFLYVSLLSLLAYVFAMGLPIVNLHEVEDYENIDDSQTELSSSQKAQKIYLDAKARS